MIPAAEAYSTIGGSQSKLYNPVYLEIAIMYTMLQISIHYNFNSSRAELHYNIWMSFNCKIRFTMRYRLHEVSDKVYRGLFIVLNDNIMLLC
jgi:hypothetical protein